MLKRIAAVLVVSSLSASAMAVGVVNGTLRDGSPLATITSVVVKGRGITARYESKTVMFKAELVYTTDEDPRQDRTWKTAPIELDVANRQARGKVPNEARAVYINFTDDRGLITSTEHVELP